MQHPAGVDAADVSRDPGHHAAVVRGPDVRHDGSLRPHSADGPPVRPFPGDTCYDVTGRRGTPGDAVDDVTDPEHFVSSETRMR